MDVKKEGGKKTCKHFHLLQAKTRPITSVDKLISKQGKCHDCGVIYGRILLCCHCQRMECVSSGHARHHFLETKHDIFFDVTLKEFYCFSCKDFLIFEESTIKTYLPSLKDHSFRQVSSKRSEYFGLRGLDNLGSTCFMNCIIQSLAHNPLFMNHYLNSPLPEDKEEFSIAIELAKTIKQLFNGQEKPFSPDKLLVVVWKNIETFAHYTQQDAHEFLMVLLNQPGIANIASNAFKGMIQSDIVCSKCNSCYSTFDPIFDLSLGVKRENVEMSSLAECLGRFIRKEKLTGGYTCKKCSQKVVATKQMIIKQLPQVICFHLKRFEQMEELSHHSTKIEHFVEFPKNIEMSPYTVNPMKKMIYKLVSVVEHKGNMESGHYVSYIKRNGSWYLFDDAMIFKIGEKQVAKCQAYLLFYARSDL